MLTVTYERCNGKAQSATCTITEDSVNGLVSIEIHTSDRQMPRLFQPRHSSVSMAEAHLDEVFPKRAGWTKTVGEA
jgi:hypothetical protein